MAESQDRNQSDDESPKIKLILKGPLDKGEVEVEEDATIKRVNNAT